MKAELLLEHNAQDQNDSVEFAAQVTKMLKPGDNILLYGNLGAGKTFLVKELSKNLGATTEASSPSFAIVNQYPGEILIYHLDFYRISNLLELYNLGLDEIFFSGAVTFVEWPQIIEQKIKWAHYRIYIDKTKKSETARIFKLYKYE